MNLFRALALFTAAVTADGKTNNDIDSFSTELDIDVTRGLSSTNDRRGIVGAEYVGDVPEDESYDREWILQEINEALRPGDDVKARLERHLSQKKQGVKVRALKGQSSREVEEDDEEYEEYGYDYELEELLKTDGRDLAHNRNKKKNNKRKKNGKRGKNKKKGKQSNKKGKKGKKNKNKKTKKNKKKNQGGKNKGSNNNNNGGVYDFGNEGFVGNSIHNNLFNDNNRRAVCIEPADPYRTCFTRAEDPNSKINRDYIDRSGYNFGIKLYKQEYTYLDPKYMDPAYNTPLEPYTRPYKMSNERLFTGSMWITLLQDDTNVNCDAQISMEETTLKYLYDNVGGPNTFEPVCVFVKNSAYDKQELLDGSGDEVESTVLELEITYVMKDSWFQKNSRQLRQSGFKEVDLEDESLLEGGDEQYNEENRDLLGSRCRPQDRALCSSQHSINTYIGRSCKAKGCGRGRLESIESRDLRATKFNNLVRSSTPFKPEMTNALLGVQNIDDVATCSTNRYAIEELDDSTTLTCDEFGDLGCMTKNDDLLPVLSERNGGCGSTTYFPTIFPTSFPTAFPTLFPTETPTMLPTALPTLFPTFSPSLEPTREIGTKSGKLPTISPTLYPTNLPTSSPTFSPTFSPTESPTLSPTLSPTITPSNIPTLNPTFSPTITPSNIPTLSPSESPTLSPTVTPSNTPTLSPTESPTLSPTESPTESPTLSPTESPTVSPTFSPTESPTLLPTLSPTNDPTKKPTPKPTNRRLFRKEGNNW